LLTVKAIRARPVVLKLKRPVVARIANDHGMAPHPDRLTTTEGMSAEATGAVHGKGDEVPHSALGRSW
jgi:hypothetical protein